MSAFSVCGGDAVWCCGGRVSTVGSRLCRSAVGSVPGVSVLQRTLPCFRCCRLGCCTACLVGLSPGVSNLQRSLPPLSVVCLYRL